MKFLIVVLLIVPITSTGKLIPLEDESFKIISGQPAKRRQFPWQASITFFEEDLFCGGSLITTRWVLTAGHCVAGKWKFEVRLGTLKSVRPYEKGSLVITTDKAIMHNNYDADELLNDIAVIDLKKHVKLSAYVKTIPLGTETIGTGVSVTASGWGKIPETGDFSPILNYVNLTTITNSECQKYYDILPDTVLCCDGSSSRTISHGDSGGPLVKYDEKGNAVLVGIATFVLKCTAVGIVNYSSKTACTNGYPSGYARIKSFYGWILSSINK